MANSYFQFKQFIIQQNKTAMKVTTDGCLFGAFVSRQISKQSPAVRTNRNILDIGTGTGLLALMAVQKNNMAVDAIEIDKEAFEQASENTALSPWHEQINIIHADVRTFKPGYRYQYIISNPPFYEQSLQGDDAKKNIAHHDRGLLLAELLVIIKKNLEREGHFYLLLPYSRNEEIKRLLAEQQLQILQLVLVRPSLHHDYFRIMIEGKQAVTDPEETIVEEISIKDDNNEYSTAFTDLLAAYYLHL